MREGTNVKIQDTEEKVEHREKEKSERIPRLSPQVFMSSNVKINLKPVY